MQSMRIDAANDVFFVMLVASAPSKCVGHWERRNEIKYCPPIYGVVASVPAWFLINLGIVVL